MKLNRVHNIAIIASDYRRSLDFYTQVLGLNRTLRKIVDYCVCFGYEIFMVSL
ncbi:MAG: VOC family protein [Muribaculaceae bacterium]|nr:VOC family protein [Muribaculaceae bacterium]